MQSPIFFGAINPYKKRNAHQKNFCIEFGLISCQKPFSIHFVENKCQNYLVMQLCLYVVFLSKKTFSHEMLLNLVQKKKHMFYQFWAPKRRAHDVSALVVNFVGVDWMPKHITISLFKIT